MQLGAGSRVTAIRTSIRCQADADTNLRILGAALPCDFDDTQWPSKLSRREASAGRWRTHRLRSTAAWPANPMSRETYGSWRTLHRRLHHRRTDGGLLYRSRHRLPRPGPRRPAPTTAARNAGDPKPGPTRRCPGARVRRYRGRRRLCAACGLKRSARLRDRARLTLWSRRSGGERKGQAGEPDAAGAGSGLGTAHP